MSEGVKVWVFGLLWNFAPIVIQVIFRQGWFMKVLNLKRIAHTSDGVFGVLIDDSGFPFCVTVELPWKNNATDTSCIPAGEYQANKIMSPKRGYQVFELQNVQGRNNIEIHIANSIHDISGCIGIGRAFGIIETKDNGDINGIQESKTVFTRFMAKMINDQSIKIVIQEG
jgi:hypothetical protein